MASQNFLGASITGGTREKTYFEQQREALVGEIANSFEHVLANINKLNRSLEAVITVGNEFSSVEALWSQFENVMAKDAEEQTQQTQQQERGAAAQQEQGEQPGQEQGQGEEDDTKMEVDEEDSKIKMER
ncbi:DASH complex subunit Dad1-domain-containing protein [Pseudoneurospora amorphoporcata]|uniref:DASH complex subunit DAD1 n=1 Tax=Pseudoneurospora amorphoporcata TaxID=241081 RepID=A0AAN6SK20_9PEZI|nr:DASH complex subunit Dad1-domain-containing protein [Pseudoneurospora amorphoporcata]